jgi:hypothetical protein
MAPNIAIDIAIFILGREKYIIPKIEKNEEKNFSRSTRAAVASPLARRASRPLSCVVRGAWCALSA